ncbi:Uncharacterized protein FWK35_00028836 [Aphis craccivora]|uniref:Uncharacterized protein n=1 Tax=Aphis craccivora TaxID=307492 RepID=A0A6G0YH24_APHCR|nr:Uncharacterized protein FWK35_00028836 [Aphis craccivora]
MMCVFFVFVSGCIITSRNNVSISNFGDGSRWISEYPCCIKKVKSKHFPTVFKKIEKNKKKSDGKTVIFTQNHITSLASISNFGDGFRRQNEYPWCIIGVKSKHFPTVFKKIEKNKKKVTENGNFYAKPVFDQTVFLYGCNSKTNHCKYIKLPPHMLLISRRYLKISPLQNYLQIFAFSTDFYIIII